MNRTKIYTASQVFTQHALNLYDNTGEKLM